MRRLFGNTDGAMAVYAVFITAVVIGAGVLALDFGKAAVLRSTMQNSADSLAMSAAKELDGQPGARERARAVIYSNMRQGSNIQDAPGDFTIQTGGIIFYARYSRDDPTPTGCIADGSGGNNSSCDTVIVDDAWAGGDLVTNAVEVRLASEQVSMILKPLIDLVSTGPGGASAFNVNARAVAERGDSACDVAPFFVCNPDEDKSLGMDLRNPSQTAGRQMVVKNGGGNVPSLPGNFGLICGEMNQDGTCASSGAPPVNAALANNDSGLCIGAGGLESQTGAVEQQVVAGINVRFGENNIGGGPQGDAATNKMGYYKDSDIASVDKSDSSLPPPVPMGGGDWNANDYWTNTHPSDAIPPVFDTDTDLLIDPEVSRYQMHLFEKDVSFCRNKNHGETVIPPTAAETGDPTNWACHIGTTMDSNVPQPPDPYNGLYTGPNPTTTDTQQRVVTVASVNCGALADAGLDIAGNTDKIPVNNGFIDYFVSECACRSGAVKCTPPINNTCSAENNGDLTVGATESGNIYAEVIGPANDTLSAQKIITNIRLVD